jgi:hypothetical protein
MQSHRSLKSTILQVCQNKKWKYTHLYLTRQYSATTRAIALFHAGNDLGGARDNTAG